MQHLPAIHFDSSHRPVKVATGASHTWPLFARVELVWKNAPLYAALVTVVADDDGSGCSTIAEHDESDNVRTATLLTCPTP
jgi:hypothetical protein